MAGQVNNDEGKEHVTGESKVNNELTIRLIKQNQMSSTAGKHLQTIKISKVI